MKNLVVVESPTKTRTLKKYLGKDFEIKASLGHIKDLPKSTLGVDVEKDFAPQYEVAPKKKKVVAELKAAAKKADQVYLATDPDREGEAIASHVYDVLRSSSKFKVQSSKFHRVVFHEITKEAVTEAFKHPREVDVDLVDAQKARRVLDRLVGYKLSPLLWKKIRYGLSAGRVQSVAVRLIVEREREREAFKPEEYWSIEALLKKVGSTLRSTPTKTDVGADPRVHPSPGEFTASLIKKDDKKLEIKNKKQTDAILKDLKKADYVVKEIKTEEKKRYPAPPFTTSTLQQNAFNTYGFSSKKTMRVAQILYERGLITYHRTDSTNLASSAVSQIRKLIAKEFGDKYLPAGAKAYKTHAKVAQEAHEAIRPTNVGLQVQSSKFKVQSSLGRDERKLYELIWKRAVACQMNPAVFDQQTVDVSAKDYLFRAVGSVLKFDGFLKVYSGKASEKDVPLPKLTEGEKLDLVKLTPSQHFTQPPARYTEATLIKELEKNGIGRPSTYAPTISTIQERGYVSKEERALKPEDVGMVVNDLLVEHFPEIVDLKFTAEMEDDLDKIADGKRKWVPVIKEFYGPFEKILETKMVELKKEDFTTLEKTKEKCPECGKPLVIKLGKYGRFLSCSGFPECKYGRPYEDKDKDGKPDKLDKSQLTGKCPECGGELVLKEGRFGKFIACSNYPKCKFTKTYLDKIGMKCPECKEGEVIVKKTKRGKVFYGCSNYPKCKFASWKDPRKKSPRKSES